MAILTLKILFVYLFLTFLFKPNLSTLNCGLWAWSGYNKTDWNPLTRFKFQLLGVEMDSRGKDGCGIAFDNIVRKSEKIKEFDEFWRNESNVPMELEYPCIMGHDRKASVGEKTFSNTQPIMFGKDSKHPVASILCHNGTLYNHESLIEKYGISKIYKDELKSMSDSQMLTLLIDKVGWSVLNEYIGSAAIIYMHASEQGSMYIYHGKSFYRKYAVVDSEERPLYYAVDDDDLWVCSTKTALEKIIADKTKIEEVPFNKVFRIDGTTLTEIFEVNRKDSFQFDGTVATTTYYGNSYSGRNSYDEDGDDSSYYYNGRWNMGNQSSKLKKYKELKKERKMAASKVSLSTLPTEKYTGDFVYFDKGLTMYKDNPLHGLVAVYSNGKVAQRCTDGGYNGAKVLYYWNGNLLKDRDSWINAFVYQAENKDKTQKEVFENAAKGFAFPYYIPKQFDGDNDVLINPTTDGLYQGLYRPLFTSKELMISAGKLYAVQYSNSGFAPIDILNKHADKYPEEYDEWLKEYTERSKRPKASSDGRLECPNCFSMGFTMENMDADKSETCPECGGEGHIDANQLNKIIGDIDELNNNMDILAEESQITMVLNDIVDQGISVLEEPDMKPEKSSTFRKLKIIKTILNNDRIKSSNV